jgi:hypothetical protein
MDASLVEMKLRFAANRLADIKRLIAADRLGSDVDARHQLSQEFFFHLVGATEYVAQLVNDRRALKIEREKVSTVVVAHEIESRFGSSDPLVGRLRSLYVPTKNQHLPADPYSGDGLLFRVLNYRHEVTHRRTNPFHFEFLLGRKEKPTYFDLDPRVGNAGKSKQPVDVDLQAMFDLVEKRCKDAMAAI